MTRMQKWQAYREEIAKQAMISQDIKADNLQIEKYKSEIDKINPAILSNVIEQDISLQKGVSKVLITQTQISKDIAQHFANISIAKNTINSDTFESLRMELRSNKIVERNNFKQDFLLGNQDYSWFINKTNVLFEPNKEADDKMAKQLQLSYDNFFSTKTEHTINPVITIDKNSQKQASHYVFVISVAVSILLLLIVISLFIAKVVLR